MTMSDEPSSIPPTRAVRSQSEIAPTAAMRGSAPGELPATSLNYSPKSRATSGRPPWLPANLSAQFNIVDVFPVGAQAEIYLVVDAAGERRVAKVYRPSTQIKEAILGKVRGVQLPHVVKMYDFGHDDGHWWETQEYAPHGTLRDLIGSDGPKMSPALVRSIVTQIHEALTALHGLKIEHRDLKPENVLVRSREPLDLALTDFGVSSDMQVSLLFSSVGGTAYYAPPEGQGTLAATQPKPKVGSDGSSPMDLVTVVSRERWDNWSLGMMTVEMLTGKHPFAGEDPGTVVSRLVSGNTDLLVSSVTDTNWRKLCRGLLRRDSTLRWGNEEVGLWLKNPNDTSLKVAEEGAHATAGYSFSGRLHYSLQELGEAFYGNWTAARRTWEIDRNRLISWIQNDLGQEVIVDAIEKAIASVRKLNVPNGLRADAETLTIATLLAPAALPVVNGIELSLKNISAYVELAKVDQTAKRKLVELLQSQVLRIAKASPDGVRLASIADAWESACRSYEQHRSELGRHGVNAPDLSDDARVTLFAAQLPDSSALKVLRERAAQADSSDARSSDWFARMGQARNADAGTLMIMPFAARVAEEAARKERQTQETAEAETKGNFYTAVGVVVVLSLLGILFIPKLINQSGNPAPAGQMADRNALRISNQNASVTGITNLPKFRGVEFTSNLNLRAPVSTDVDDGWRMEFLQFDAPDNQILARFDVNGEFLPGDNLVLSVTYPNGTIGTCELGTDNVGVCAISRDNRGWIAPGEYSFEARTRHKILDVFRFRVN